jgi:NAD(P)-dependent dehydrogenase (short-subunit alcohol dehydrogenase family)
MDLELKGRIVLVTGGSKGIGLACARVFAREGAKVAIASRDTANLEKARATLQAEGVTVVTVCADLKDPTQAAAMAKAVETQLGPIDVLVNSAGAAKRTPPAELTAAHWHAAMESKYFTYIHAMDAVLPGMAKRGSGVVVNVVGSGGKVANPVHLPGGSANAALMLASAGLGRAYAGKGIRVVAVNPAATNTERLQSGTEAEARAAGIPVEEMMATRTKQHPMGRFAEPEEVADVVAFLASKRASYVNGAVLALDGGATATVV